MHFVKLTMHVDKNTLGRPRSLTEFVNLDLVRRIVEVEPGVTCLEFLTAAEDDVFVKESPEEIIRQADAAAWPSWFHASPDVDLTAVQRDFRSEK